MLARRAQARRGVSGWGCSRRGPKTAAARNARSAGDRPDERLNIAFGVERLGFLGLKAPMLALVALALLVALAVAGVMPHHRSTIP